MQRVKTRTLSISSLMLTGLIACGPQEAMDAKGQEIRDVVDAIGVLDAIADEVTGLDVDITRAALDRCFEQLLHEVPPSPRTFVAIQR